MESPYHETVCNVTPLAATYVSKLWIKCSTYYLTKTEVLRLVSSHWAAWVSKLSRGSLKLSSLGPCRMRDCSGPMVYNLSHIKRVLDLAATAICFGLKNQFFIERERESVCAWVGGSVCEEESKERERERERMTTCWSCVFCLTWGIFMIAIERTNQRPQLHPSSASSFYVLWNSRCKDDSIMQLLL